MPAPSVPDFTPFDPADQPNLLAGGPYDQFLNQLESYLVELKAYVDSMADVTALQAEVAQLKTTVTNMTSVQYQAPSGTSYPLFTSAGAAGTALGQISGGIGAADTAADAAQGAAEAAQEDATAAKTWTENASSVNISLPNRINGTNNGVLRSNYALFDSAGNAGAFANSLNYLLSAIMLAAPNGDQSSLFGYLGDNSTVLTTAEPVVRSSAALTSASETGGVGFTMGPSDSQLTAGDVATDAKLAPIEGESGKYVVYVEK